MELLSLMSLLSGEYIRTAETPDQRDSKNSSHAFVRKRASKTFTHENTIPAINVRGISIRNAVQRTLRKKNTKQKTISLNKNILIQLNILFLEFIDIMSFSYL